MKINTINLIASILAAVFWFTSPFINSSGLELFSISSTGKDILLITVYDLTMNLKINAANLTLCIASGGSAICIIGTFAGVIKKNNSSVEMYSFLGAFSMIPAFVAAFTGSQGSTVGEILEIFGSGYYVIFLLFILIPIISIKNTAIEKISETKSIPRSNDSEHSENQLIGNSSTENLSSAEKEDLKNEIKKELLFQKHEKQQNGTKTCFCRSCKKEFPEDCSFCGYCGTSLS